MTDAKDTNKPGKEVVYLDVDDDITTVIDKVDAAKEKLVALVLPKRATTLQSIVNMRLLARSAKSSGKSIVLITTEAALLPLAGAAKIHVAKDLQSPPKIPAAPGMMAEPSTKAVKEPVEEKYEPTKGEEETMPLPSKIDYDKSIGELAEAHDIEHPETIELGDEENEVAEAAKGTEKMPKAPKLNRVKIPNFDRFRLWLALGAVGIVALITFLIFALFVLPKATIAIQTVNMPISASFNLTTSDSAKSLDETKNIIPASLKTSDQTNSQQITATGQQNNGTKATGTVNFSATECAPNIHQPPPLSGGTGISTQGLTFITQADTNFSSTPSGGSGSCVTYSATTSTPIKAQSGGTKYTISSSTFTVPSRSDVSGTGSASGGTDNIQTVVAQSDLDNVVQKITSASSDSFSKSFQSQLDQQGYYILASTLKIGDPSTTSSPSVGQPASTANVTVKVTYSVLVIKKADLQKAITDALSQQIDKSKQKVDDSTVLKDASVSVTNQSSPTAATLNVVENTSAIPLLDTANIKKQSAGQKVGDITAAISGVPGVKSVNVKLSPFWVSKTPKNTGKITVTIQHVSG